MNLIWLIDLVLENYVTFPTFLKLYHDNYFPLVNILQFDVDPFYCFTKMPILSCNFSYKLPI